MYGGQFSSLVLNCRAGEAEHLPDRAPPALSTPIRNEAERATDSAPDPRLRRDHRRRGDGAQHGLPPGPRRGHGRRPGREGRARVRLDLQGRRRGAGPVLRRGQHRARARAACRPSRRSRPPSARRSTCTRSATCSCSSSPEHVAAFEKNVALQNELGVPSRHDRRRGGQGAVAADQHRGTARRGVLADATGTAPPSPSSSATPAPRAGRARAGPRLRGHRRSTSSGGASPHVVTGPGDHPRPTRSSARPAPGRRDSAPWSASTCRSSRCAGRS